MTSAPASRPPIACWFGASELTLADFAQAVRHEPRTRRLIRTATWIGATSFALGVALSGARRGQLGLVLCVLGALCFAAYNAPDHIAQRWFSRNPREALAARYTVSPQGLIVSTSVSRVLHDWTELHGFIEAPDVFLIWVSPTLFLVVPKRAFAAEERAAVARMLQAQLGPPPTQPRFLSWLVLAALLGALALALWNWASPR